MARSPSPAPSSVTVYHDEGSIPSESTVDRYAFIETEPIRCCPKCICKIRAKLNDPNRSPHHEAGERNPRKWSHAPVKEVVSHRFHKNTCFLLCVLDSPRANPIFLRQCEVPDDLRSAYHDYLTVHKEPKPVEEYWRRAKEIQLRQELFGDLSPEEQKRQLEIFKADSTAQWQKDKKRARRKSGTAGAARQDQPRKPSFATKDMYIVEKVIGARWESNPVEKKLVQQTSYLLKWDGYDINQSNWQLASQCKCVRAIQDFYALYGKAGPKRPFVLAPEGEQFETARIRGTLTSEISQASSSTTSKKRKTCSRESSTAPDSEN